MSSSLQCFVPHCNASKDRNPNLNFFPLPKDHKFKETWLALTGRKVVAEERVHFCESHFRRSACEIVMGRVVGLTSKALPYHGMPQMICRTCMTTIPQTDFFCVVSGKIPSPVPPELDTNLIQCRPEPLFHIFTFCIPNLSLQQNPPSFICIKCYHNIWQYFIFKLTCNSFENRNRGSLSPEEYGKLVRCRACPETSDTRFFLLSETQPMGHVFKNIFQSNYLTHIVPLKLCLKCWNKVYELTKFHQQCVVLDQMIQRCKEINGRQAYHRTSTFIGPSETVNSAVASPSTSSCPSNSSFTSVNKFNATSEEVDKTKLMHMAKTKPKLDFTNNNIDIGPGVKVDSEPKQNTAIYSKNKTNFVERSRIVLANLMLKHSQLLKPGLDPIEKAKSDLEMWVNVVKEFHNLGYTHTLESIQYTWSKMKSKANIARKSIGPMTYLDYLVHSYVTGVGTTDKIVIELDDENNNDGGQTENICIAGTSNNAIQRENCKTLADSGNKHITNTVELQSPTSDGSEIHPVSDDYDVICLDDVEIQESCSTQLKNDCDANVKGAILNNCDISIRKDGDKDRDDKTLKTLLDFRLNKVTKMLPRPRGNKQKRTTKRKHRALRKAWNHEQKLELLQEIRKEYNRLIEKEDLNLSKYSPWKLIIERIALKGFKDYNFSKMYYQWGKMKVSAMVHEKNGVDTVDNETWELLQLHSDVQKNLSKPASNNEYMKAGGDDTTPKIIHGEERKTPPPKKQKLFTPTHSSSHISISSYPNAEEVSVGAREASKSPSTPVTAKRSYIYLSEDEKLEILELIEGEFDKMLSAKGAIYEPLSLILNRIKYKNYSADNLLYNWQKLSVEASVHGKAPTPTHEKVQRLLKIYRENRRRRMSISCDAENSKQKIEEKAYGSSHENSTKTSNPSMHNDEEKLDLISVIRSFGNEVFKTDVRSKRTDFWVQVTAKFHSMGYSKKPNDLCSMWGNMLRSAKLTWAQEDRKPSVGDQEIIDFMTEVIREKEKSEMDSKLDLSVEENEISEDSGSCQEGDDNFEEDPEVKEGDSKDCLEPLPNEVEEFVVKVDDNEVEDVKILNNSESTVENVAFDDYEYVSFEDIKKHFKIDIIGKPKLAGMSEVIEITDSDEE